MSRLRFGLLAVLVGVPLAVSGCGTSSGPQVAHLTTTTTHTTHSRSSSAGSTNHDSALAFSHCMRSHGVPNFPDPNSQGSFPTLSQQALGVSKQTSLVAQHACEHLLSHGSGGTPQQGQEKVAFGLKLAQCLRKHGFPNFPDPNGTSQQVPAGIDPNSPTFKAAENLCQKSAAKAVGLS
jgi:hypothetical protein